MDGNNRGYSNNYHSCIAQAGVCNNSNRPYGNRTTTPRYTSYNHVRQSSSYFGVIPTNQIFLNFLWFCHSINLIQFVIIQHLILFHTASGLASNRNSHCRSTIFREKVEWKALYCLNNCYCIDYCRLCYYYY